MKRNMIAAVCLIFSLFLVLSACGTRPASDGTLPAPGTNGSAGSQAAPAASASSVETLAPVNAGPVYDQYGIVLSVTQIEELGR